MDRRELIKYSGFTVLSYSISNELFANNRKSQIIHGFSQNSVTGLFAQFASDSINRSQHIETYITSFSGNHGWNALQILNDGTDASEKILLIDSLTLALYAEYEQKQTEVLSLTPIAKITKGISTCLISSKNSGINDWHSLNNAARKRKLKIACSGMKSPYGVAMRWISDYAAPMELVLKLGNGNILEAVRNNEVDVGIVATNSLIDGDNRYADDEVNIVCSFGAKRSPLFPATQTFSEIVDDTKRDYTIAFSVFTDAGTPKDFSQKLEQALLVPPTPEMLKPLGALSVHVDLYDAKEATRTLKRDLRVAKTMRNQ